MLSCLGPRQREIEQYYVQGVRTPDHPHGNVVGLDVPMGDPLLLEVIHDVEQVHAKSLEMLDVETSLLTKSLTQGFNPILGLVDEDWSHQEGGVIADLDELAEFNDVLVPELLENLGFVLDTSVLLRFARGFEHVVDSGALDEECSRAGALTQTLLDRESAGEQISLLGLSRVADILMLGCGELVLDDIEVFEKIGDRVDPARHVGMSRKPDQILKACSGTIHDRTDLQTLGFSELVAQFETIGRG